MSEAVATQQPSKVSSALEFLRSIWAVAVYTWREGMRKKTLIGFLILSFLVIFGANLVTSFLFETSADMGAGSETATKLIKDISIAAISIFGALITIFISASVVPTEVDNKVIYTILSKPVWRLQYLLGKFLGVQLIVLLNLLLMGLLFFFALYFREQTLPTLLLWALLLTYLQFLIVSAFTFAVSCAASSAVLPTIAGLFIYITGYMTPYLKNIEQRTGQTEQFLDVMIQNTASLLYNILPNLQEFSLRTEIIYMQLNDVPAKVTRIPNLTGYSLAFTLAGFIIAFWVFRRREL